MIDISIYQQKLVWLKEYIADRIDGRISPPMWVNLGALDFNHTIDEIMSIYEQCGIMFYTPAKIIENPAIPISFEEYCKFKQSLINK